MAKIFKAVDNCPEKPKTQREQVDTLWDIVANHLWHKMYWLDIKLNFLLAFIAVILTLLGLVLGLVFKHVIV